MSPDLGIPKLVLSFGMVNQDSAEDANRLGKLIMTFYDIICFVVKKGRIPNPTLAQFWAWLASLYRCLFSDGR